MSRFVKVATIDEMAEQRIKCVQVEGQKIALIDVEGEIYALSDTCIASRRAIVRRGA